MKFTGSIEINQSLQKVVELFADPANLKEYQEGFVKKELVSGTAGEDGAISKMYYKSGKREMELEETITANRLPNTFEAHYHHKHMDNTLKCTFTVISETATKYETEVEYTRIDWIMPKLMSIFFRGMYRKGGERWMVNFKNFAERQPGDEVK